MTELTEHLKLKNIPDEEIGNRLRAYVYFYCQLFATAYVAGITCKNFIKTIKLNPEKLWHGTTAEQKRWTKLSSYEQPKMISQHSSLQLKSKEPIAVDSSEECSLKKVSLLQTDKHNRKLSRSKPRGFKDYAIHT